MTHDPYASSMPATPFTLSSPDFPAGGPLPQWAYNTDAGQNISPALTWSDLPTGTRSVLLTAFDADAPIPGGFWHWAVKDIPAHVTDIERGGTSGISLPNSLGLSGYSGARPPAGTGRHHLYFAATALDVDVLPVPEGTSLALLHAMIIPHTLGRAILTATADAPA